MLVFGGFFLICIVVLAFLFVKRFRKNRKMGIVLISLLVLFALAILIVKIERGFIPLPMGLRQLMYLAMPPKDLYEPIVTDNFLFYEKGFTKTYLLRTKYLTLYNIGFLVKTNNLPSKYKFNGKVKADFYWKDKFLFSKEIASLISASYANNDLEHFSDVCLLCFEMPVQGKYKDDISVQLTVLEPDESLRQYGDSIKLFIGVGALE